MFLRTLAIGWDPGRTVSRLWEETTEKGSRGPSSAPRVVEVLHEQLPLGSQIWGRWGGSSLGVGGEYSDAQVIRHLHPALWEGVGAVACD